MHRANIPSYLTSPFMKKAEYLVVYPPNAGGISMKQTVNTTAGVPRQADKNLFSDDFWMFYKRYSGKFRFMLQTKWQLQITSRLCEMQMVNS